MNYFELYDMPVTFMPDKQQISQRYFELQKKHHPDFFANATEDEKEQALEFSAMANKAYKTFQNGAATMKYVLQLKGMVEEEEKYNLPQSFLTEVMELNEMKMDGAGKDEIEQRTAVLQSEISIEVQPVIENYRDGITSEADLLKIKEYYYKLKYLARIKENT